MFKPLALTASLALWATLGTGSAQAQDLEGQVLRNPDDTVTYDFHFDGPPQGKARLYMSLWLLDPYYPSPSLGNLYLDPFFWMPVSAFLNLPPSGQADLNFQVPSVLTEGIPLTFQSINLDVLGNLRFSNNAKALAQNRFLTPCALDYTFAYDAQRLDLELQGHAPVGALVQMQVVEGTRIRVDIGEQVGSSGEYQLRTTVPGGVTRQDRVQILCDGQVVDSVGLHR